LLICFEYIDEKKSLLYFYKYCKYNLSILIKNYCFIFYETKFMSDVNYSLCNERNPAVLSSSSIIIHKVRFFLKPLSYVFHGFRLLSLDDYFWVIFDNFCIKNQTLRGWGKSKNWIVLKIQTPYTNLAILNWLN
jgi:hypothetical protein